MYEITFQFENGAQEVKFSAAPGSTILEAAKSANVAIDAPCNGNGSCGKCRVKLVSGEVTGVQTGHISDEDYAAGWRLSCSTKPAGDITVLVPDIASAYQSRMKTADLSSGEEIAIFNQLQQDVQAAGVDFANDFVQAVLTLDEPTLDDTMPDTERLARFAQDAFDGCTEVRLTYHTVKKLAKTLREANFKVQITGTLTDGVLTIMDVSEKEDAPLYGCAIDIGTTTVTGVLMDLKTGTLTAKASAGNGQIRYGADVINRIVEQGKPGGTKRLQDAILKETLPLLPVHMKAPNYGCSAFATVSAGNILMGRNYDFKRDTSAMLVYCTPKDGYKSVALAALDNISANQPDLSMAKKLACLTAPFICVDGRNEKGVTIAVLALDSEPVIQSTG